ncbi:MAG: TRAP transporter substrate-binding protein [Synergistaceae bacterium]|jgi:tripartite ATP-independent transporter DctP family solute receptor|nr:TRAP transporter substrate-binding protein [Synergistaceae bacterium]
MVRKTTFLALTAFCFAFLYAPVYAAEPKHTFAFTNDSAEDTVTQLMTVKMAELLAAKSGGAFKTEVYGQSQLGSDRELAQSCQAGDIAFVFQTHAPTVNFVPELSVLDLPMLFASLEQARVVLDKFQPVISGAYEKAGFKILGFGDQGFREMSTNKKIERPADFKGIKIRTMENKYHMAFWRAIGANPTPLPWGEVYLSLQQGTIDAQENPLEVIVAAKLYEQQRYIVQTHHIPHTITILMSKNIYDSLTPEERKIVDESARETVLYAREQANQRARNRIDVLKDNNTEILELTDVVRAELVELAKPVYDDIRKGVGGDLVNALLKEIEAAK